MLSTYLNNFLLILKYIVKVTQFRLKFDLEYPKPQEPPSGEIPHED